MDSREPVGEEVEEREDEEERVLPMSWQEEGWLGCAD